MFKDSYKVASKFTFPVIQSIRYFNNEIECGLGAFILLNNSGWILTAAHIVKGFDVFHQHQIEIANYSDSVTNINGDTKIGEDEKIQQIENLPKNNKWIKNISYWWGNNGVVIPSFNILPQADIAIGRIDNFTSAQNQIYPKFKVTSDDFLGKSLCKLGFPFHKINASWDSTTNTFNIPQEIFPIVRFPIDGIGTRFLLITDPNNIQVRLLETSTPGLKGQSGGPIFDTDGNVCAMQSYTNHYPLGFNPEIDVDGVRTTEHQFLNIGVGVSTETILPFLQNHQVNVEVIN